MSKIETLCENLSSRGIETKKSETLKDTLLVKTDNAEALQALLNFAFEKQNMQSITSDLIFLLSKLDSQLIGKEGYEDVLNAKKSVHHLLMCMNHD